MTIGIYKIQNKINQEVYIGRSIDINRRWAEHKRSGQPDKNSYKNERDINTPIHLALQKHGLENFVFEVIKECKKEQLDELEKYYINYYKATDKKYGYNISSGDQDYVGAKGEFHSQAKLTQQQVDQIYKRLLQNESVKNIHKDFNFVNKSIISMINQGHIWKKEGYVYPLSIQNRELKGSKNPNAIMTENIVIEMRKYYVNHSFSEVVEKYKSKYTYSNIRSVIYGDSWKHLPIYKKRTKTWI